VVDCSKRTCRYNKKELGGSFICKSCSTNFADKRKGFEENIFNEAQQGTPINIHMKIVEYGQYLRYGVEKFIKNDLLLWDADSQFSKAINGIKKRRNNIRYNDLDKINTLYQFCNWTTAHVDVGDAYQKIRRHKTTPAFCIWSGGSRHLFKIKVQLAGTCIKKLRHEAEFFLFGFDRFDIHELFHLELSGEGTHATIHEAHDSGCGCEKRVVFSAHNILTGVDCRSALTDKNITGLGVFAAVFFHTKALTLRIAAIGCRSACFFVCHRVEELITKNGNRIGVFLALVKWAHPG